MILKLLKKLPHLFVFYKWFMARDHSSPYRYHSKILPLFTYRKAKHRPSKLAFFASWMISWIIWTHWPVWIKEPLPWLDYTLVKLLSPSSSCLNFDPLPRTLSQLTTPSEHPLQNIGWSQGKTLAEKLSDPIIFASLFPTPIHPV